LARRSISLSLSLFPDTDLNRSILFFTKRENPLLGQVDIKRAGNILRVKRARVSFYEAM